MARSINEVTLLGNVGAEPEIKAFQNGGKVANFTLATNERWKDKKTGEIKEKTEWHLVSVLGVGLVGIVEKYVSKGSRLYLKGQLETRKWQDKQGADRYTTEVVIRPFGGNLILLDAKEEAAAAVDAATAAPQGDDAAP